MEYPYFVRDERIGTLNLRVIGVEHTSEFLEEHEEYFREELDRAGHLFLEGGLETNTFYQSLANMADGQHGIIYVPDDSSNIGHLLHDMTMSATGFQLVTRSLENPISRRNFFRKGLMAVGGLYLLTSLGGIRENILQGFFLGPEGTLDNMLAYDCVVDLRNMVTAENFARAEKDLGIRGNATYFVGVGHVNGLRAYIRNPELRKKRVLYLPQELFTDSKIKVYQKIDGDWRVVKTV